MRIWTLAFEVGGFGAKSLSKMSPMVGAEREINQERVMGLIDWTAAAQVVSLTKDVLLGAGAVVTAGVAVIGLNRWRRELSGKAEFEAALDLIAAVHELRDTLVKARLDVVYSYEFAERLNMRDMTPDEIAEAYGYMP